MSVAEHYRSTRARNLSRDSLIHDMGGCALCDILESKFFIDLSRNFTRCLVKVFKKKKKKKKKTKFVKISWQDIRIHFLVFPYENSIYKKLLKDNPHSFDDNCFTVYHAFDSSFGLSNISYTYRIGAVSQSVDFTVFRDSFLGHRN